MASFRSRLATKVLNSDAVRSVANFSRSAGKVGAVLGGVSGVVSGFKYGIDVADDLTAQLPNSLNKSNFLFVAFNCVGMLGGTAIGGAGGAAVGGAAGAASPLLIPAACAYRLHVVSKRDTDEKDKASQNTPPKPKELPKAQESLTWKSLAEEYRAQESQRTR